ncbi:aspartyl/asparaginyl beta-hydroxylase domain-containing protein [Phenylobacterium parvum]|uniref:Aspartyl beta-hydroxylase n=1 Tax=Phenylobacterium parvum TaxID=2201350 RepID=A0A2Z3HTU6_9CAUL|nr:aspartyl/asparaginyl beta-hydroxylase domain-containing protein [Phenylobacterium parvum]AWM76750.1 aspartyl beta-hydroxylase [Phenylobacterium parvum]
MAVMAWADAARAAARIGRWTEAETLWRQVLEADARHPEALYSLGVHALQAGRTDESVDLLSRACEAAPQEATVWVFLSTALRTAGRPDEAWEAIQSALVADPYSLPALLSRGGLLEDTQGPAAALTSYRNALKVAPPSQHWPPHLRGQLEHASQVVEAETRAYQDYLVQSLSGLIAQGAPADRPKWREALSILSGASRPYLSDANQLYMPRLPAIPFFERRHFPWIEALESHTDTIRKELEAALAKSSGAFNPYITYAPGQPVNQWAELNHSDRWSTLDLWKSGTAAPENQRICPATTQALAEVDLARIEGLCPNVMFSALAPRTRIPPHHGETNARLIAHLPLVVPPDCEFRVGFDRIQWRPGEVIVFDDTLEHEAYNGSDLLRTVLIFDVWNPLLSEDDRAIILAMAAAARTYRAD